MKTNDIVTYKQPNADEIGMTYTIIEIDTAHNWCLMVANNNMTIRPTYTANLTDLEIVTK